MLKWKKLSTVGKMHLELREIQAWMHLCLVFGRVCCVLCAEKRGDAVGDDVCLSSPSAPDWRFLDVPGRTSLPSVVGTCCNLQSLEEHTSSWMNTQPLLSHSLEYSKWMA